MLLFIVWLLEIKNRAECCPSWCSMKRGLNASTVNCSGTDALLWDLKMLKDSNVLQAAAFDPDPFHTVPLFLVYFWISAHAVLCKWSSLHLLPIHTLVIFFFVSKTFQHSVVCMIFTSLVAWVYVLLQGRNHTWLLPSFHFITFSIMT